MPAALEYTFSFRSYVSACEALLFFSSRSRHTRWPREWSSDVCSSDLHSGTKRNISYKIIKESGPSHNKTFVANVLLDKEIILGTGEGKTKKEAEQKAAEEALKRGNRSEERRVGKACRCRS